MTESTNSTPKGFLRLNDSTLERALDGETVLLNLATEVYFSLDEVGARLFEIMRQSASFDEAQQTALAEFDVDAETLTDDMTRLLAELMEADLVHRA